MARPRSDLTVIEVMPGSGLEIYQQPGRASFYVRRYDQQSQRYIRRSTGQKTEDEAKAWVLSNLQELFGQEVERRGGGNYSITRQLSAHLDFIQQRYEAGELSHHSLTGYKKSGRHFIKWFALHNLKKLGELSTQTFKRYGLDRINKDGYAPSTVNLEIVYLRMWITWLQDEEIINRPIKVPGVQQAVENRTGSEPFQPGDLKRIYKEVDKWIDEKVEYKKGNFGNQRVSVYNKKLFKLFLQLLDESGARQHEIMPRTWKDIRVLQTNTDRKRYINEIAVPQKAKRGARKTVFRGESLLLIKELQKRMCPNHSESDYLFRNHQTNTCIDISTFARYWSIIQEKTETEYVFHTFRSHRITQLIMGRTQPQLVARNLGLSLKQIEKSYLRFVPAGHYNELVQNDIPEDTELSRLM